MSMMTFDEAKKAAKGRWHSILTSQGIHPSHLTGKHTPCPYCGGTDRFRFDNRDGDGTFLCGRGGNLIAGDGFSLLQHGGFTAAEALRRVVESLGEATYKAPVPFKKDRSDYAMQLWSEGVSGSEFHPYAKRKGVSEFVAGTKRHKSVSGRVVGRKADCILIPLFDLMTMEVKAVQVINANGDKQTFGSVSNRGFPIGDKANPNIFIVEGWADAVSLAYIDPKYAGNCFVIAAFGQSNLLSLSKVVSTLYKPEVIHVIADAPVIKEEA